MLHFAWFEHSGFPGESAGSRDRQPSTGSLHRIGRPFAALR